MEILIKYLRSQIKAYQGIIKINEVSRAEQEATNYKPGIQYFEGKIDSFQFCIKSMSDYLKILEDA